MQTEAETAALERLERALASLEAAAAAAPATATGNDLFERHDRLRTEVAECITELDAMLVAHNA